MIDRGFKRPTLTHSLKGKERELQTIYNPHHKHLYPVSLQVFFILSGCSSFSSIFQEPATFAGEFPLFCSLWRYRWQWQHCCSPGIWTVFYLVYFTVLSRKIYLKVHFIIFCMSITGIIATQKSVFLTFMIQNWHLWYNFHFSKKKNHLSLTSSHIT